MKLEKWFWIGIGLIFIGGYWAILDEMANQYSRGYADGADSLSDKHVNEVCMQWLFQSNLKEAKKKVCNK
jgi:hypothetical protein